MPMNRGLKCEESFTLIVSGFFNPFFCVLFCCVPQERLGTWPGPLSNAQLSCCSKLREKSKVMIMFSIFQSICLSLTVFFAFCGIELAVEHSR